MDDPFDDLLNLEEQYYEEGYQQGYQDGKRQSHLEARLFGIEKGFEKFVIMGKLQARAQIWSSRMNAGQPLIDQSSSFDTPEGAGIAAMFPPLQRNSRLEKHMSILLALVDPSTLSMENTDDAVAEFDDRLKRAQAKEKIIEKVIGEDGVNSTISNQQGTSSTLVIRDMENFGSS